MVTLTWKGGGAGKVPDQGDTGIRVYTYVGVGDEADAIAELDDTFDVSQNSPWDEDTQNLICQSVYARRTSMNTMDLTASYAYAPTGYFQPTIDPLSLPDRYEWTPVIDDVPFDRDVDNNPVLNSAYDPPSNPPRKKILYWRLSIFRNVESFDYATASSYANVVNSDTIEMTGPNSSSVELDPGTIFCNYVRPTRAYTLNDTVVPIEIMLDIYNLANIDITDPFQLHILDVGKAAYYGSGSKGNIVYAAGGGEGQAPADAVPLDGTGIPIELAGSANFKVVDAGGSLQTIVAAPHGTPQGASIETSGNTDFPAVYLRWKRYPSVPLLPLLNPEA